MPFSFELRALCQKFFPGASNQAAGVVFSLNPDPRSLTPDPFLECLTCLVAEGEGKKLYLIVQKSPNLDRKTYKTYNLYIKSYMFLDAIANMGSTYLYRRFSSLSLRSRRIWGIKVR
jgi:hypothetical protein